MLMGGISALWSFGTEDFSGESDMNYPSLHQTVHPSPVELTGLF